MEFWDLYDVDRKLTGRTIARGQKMKDDEYHLVVTAWILNREGKWLITKRSASKSKPLKWEAPGGSVLAGEDSRQGVYREIKEEIGIDLSGGELFKSFRRDIISWENPGFLDVWIFKMDFDLSDVVMQDEEVCDVKWASADEIIKMMENDEFVPMKEFPYYKEIFREYEAIGNIVG